MRIISVVPSLTELLFDLGLDDQIVGVTRFCIHPAEKVAKTKNVGGTKKLKLDVITSLNPDLIIANKEENSKDDILELQKNHTVLLTDIFTLEDAIDVITQIGKLTQTTLEASQLIEKIDAGFNQLKNTPTPNHSSCAYLIWQKPIMLAGRNTFINDLLNKMGVENLIESPNSRYPDFTLTELKEAKPAYLFLSSEPFPFKEVHQTEFEKEFPDSQVILVDGEMFSWYGSRLALAPYYFAKLLKQLN
jgi:ABC-type Fe3+-hydroxamate transport system substrate-binding protein